MDNTQQTGKGPSSLDSASEVKLTDPEVIGLYNNGLISRAEADVFDIIADFNDGRGGIRCQTN